jgi:putative flippase GtrA
MQTFVQIITKIIDFFYRPFGRYIPQQLFRYAVCGGGNLVLDWILYFIVYNFIIGHELIYINFFHNSFCFTPHILSFLIVFPITLITGFWLNKHITFTQSSLQGYKQLYRYILVVIVNILINYFGLKLCVDIFGLYPTPSKMIITIITVVISFFCQKYFSFRE